MRRKPGARPTLRALASAALLTATAASAASGDVRHGALHAASLGRDVGYVVSLPASYDASGRRYPVLYVLHGLFEGPEFWHQRGLDGLLEAEVAARHLPEVIVIAVDGDNSFFVDGPEGRYQDLVTDDLVAHVESRYRTRPGRDSRALLGVSMGGYAALRIALTQPERFGVVAAHSAMLLGTVPSAEAGASRWHMTAFHHAFGDPIDVGLWDASNPLALVAGADPGRVPALYFDCGQQDRYGLATGAAELHRKLESRGIPHEFALLPGDHGYDYVRSVLPRSLAFIGRHLAPERPGGVARKENP